jgi:hypothetical protein
LPGIDELPAELIQAGSKIYFEIHKLIHYLWNKNSCHSSGRNTLLYVFIKGL